ncbi:MAG: M61 family metallopeptidase [Gammaproteobacteria bacterium]|nr:M61 family metallopeptidase [Gammaproteobacteria bacterium]
MISYRVSLHNPEAHLFRVSLWIPQPKVAGQIINMPAWIPGSYMIRDFAKSVVTLNASSNGKPVQFKKLDKQRWQFAPVDDGLEIEYEVYAWDLSVRSAHLDTTHGYFNGTSLFFRVEGLSSESCKVEMQRPEGASYNSWQLATTLPVSNCREDGFGEYQAESYEQLIDHPVEIGDFTRGQFEVANTLHKLVISGRHRSDMTRIEKDLGRICKTHIEMFGELPAMDQYLFQVMAVGDGYGGLEHCNSTSLVCKRDDLPYQNQQEMSDGYRQFLGLCSHEYFHLWNVKRIKPEVYRTAELSQEVYTSLLWAFEGITSYYDDLALVRSGVIDEKSYLELLAQTISRVIKGSGRHKQTVSESSFDTWTKFYKQDENAPNAIVSYYAKGALVALALDLTIRKRTGSKCSLDDVMCILWQRFGVTGKGVGERDIEQIACEVAGADMGGFFDLALRSTDDLPLESLLSDMGVVYKQQPASSPKDRGGFADTEQAEKLPGVALGAAFKSDEGGVRLTFVYDDGAAQRSGLASGDLLVAIDGLRANSDNIESLLNCYSVGERLQVTAFRRDELMTFTLAAQRAPADTCYLALSDDQNAARQRCGWLKTASDD